MQVLSRHRFSVASHNRAIPLPSSLPFDNTDFPDRECLLFFLRWYGNTRDLHVDGAQMISAGEVEGFPIIASKRQIGGGRCAMYNAAQLSPLRIHGPYPTGAATVDVPFNIHLHTVGDTRFIAT